MNQQSLCFIQFDSDNNNNFSNMTGKLLFEKLKLKVRYPTTRKYIFKKTETGTRTGTLTIFQFGYELGGKINFTLLPPRQVLLVDSNRHEVLYCCIRRSLAFLGISNILNSNVNHVGYLSIHHPMVATWWKPHNHVIIGHINGFIGIWMRNQEKVVYMAQRHPSKIMQLLVNENKNEVLSVYEDGVINLWCLVTHKLLKTFIDVKMHRVDSICFINEQKTLFVAASRLSNTINIWDTVTGKCTGTVPHDHNGVSPIQLKFSLTKKVLISADYACIKMQKLDLQNLEKKYTTTCEFSCQWYPTIEFANDKEDQLFLYDDTGRAHFVSFCLTNIFD